VDQWRLIGFNADLLESDLNVIFSGDMATPLGDNMFDFRRQTGRLSVGVQFDAPLTRKAERNQYREAIINFQALRRSYIQYTDGVHQAVRHHLRTLAEARENLELQRKSFNIALRAFNLTRLKLREPPKDEKPSPTTARDLLGALSDLLGAQNNFMSVWIQYEAARMRLYRDLGIMEFDEHGAWVEQPLDPYKEAVQEALAPELASPESDDPVLPPPRPLPPADQKEE
jgi:outer membrane protein TolC